MQIEPRKRLVSNKPEELTLPDVVCTVRSFHLIHDQLRDSRGFRLLNVVDDFNREALGVELTSHRPGNESSEVSARPSPSARGRAQFDLIAGWRISVGSESRRYSSRTFSAVSLGKMHRSSYFVGRSDRNGCRSNCCAI